MEYRKLSKSLILKKIREAKENGESIIKTDYEKISLIKISYDGISVNKSYYIEFFQVHNANDSIEKRFSYSIKDALEEIGAYIPNFLKLHNNY